MVRWLQLFVLGAVWLTASHGFAAPYSVSDADPAFESDYQENVPEWNVAPAQYQSPGRGNSTGASPFAGAAPGSVGAAFASAARTKSWESYVSRPSKVFGDLYFGGGTLTYSDPLVATTSLPLAGGAGRLSIADNNMAPTDDRMFVNYNHFHHALETDNSTFNIEPGSRSFNVDRFTIGAEKTFFGDRTSLQVQLPVTQGFDYITQNFSVSGQRAGNLQILTKVIAWEAPDLIVSAGLGLDLPTGGNVMGTANFARYIVHNDAVHLAPYAAYLWDRGTWFSQGFLQYDVATRGNSVEFLGFFGPQHFGQLNEQALLRFNQCFGVWIYADETATSLTGLAAQLELHYTTTVTDADVLDTGPGPIRYIFSSPGNRIDMLNLTAGLNFEFANRAELRVGGGVPLTAGANRTFDAEVVVQLSFGY